MAPDPEPSKQKDFLKSSALQDPPPWESANLGPPAGYKSNYPNFVKSILELDGSPQFEFWKALASAVDGAREIHRFSDRRQTIFEGDPLPDGSNLHMAHPLVGGGDHINGSALLYRTFQIFRQWLIFLHYDQLLIFQPQNPGGELVYGINDSRISQHLHEQLKDWCEELKQTGETNLPPEGFPLHSFDSLSWVQEWRNDVTRGIALMQAANTWASVNSFDGATAVQLVSSLFS